MKAIKKNFENLKAVAKRIEAVPYGYGKFYIYREFPKFNSICLVSERDSVGYVVLRHIPCNYRYHLTFRKEVIELLIWFD